jgi:hypothetical protein
MAESFGEYWRWTSSQTRSHECSKAGQEILSSEANTGQIQRKAEEAKREGRHQAGYELLKTAGHCAATSTNATFEDNATNGMFRRFSCSASP